MRGKFLTFLIIILTLQGYSQFKYLEFKLDISASFLLSSSHVVIELTNDSMGYKLKVKSTPWSTEAKYSKNKIDTIYLVSKEEVNKIGELLNEMSSEQIFKGINVNDIMIVNEGRMCKLEYGSYLDKITFSIWSPDCDTKERNIELFYQACKEILKLGKLNPKKIF